LRLTVYLIVSGCDATTGMRLQDLHCMHAQQ